MRDRWNRNFTRLVQLLGLGLGVHEAAWPNGGRGSVLLYSAALIIGPQGLRLLLRGAGALDQGARSD